jgi:tetratricopeptide (TPR) repeat protein
MDEALLAYRRAIAADPLERDAQPLYHAGQILMYQGQYEEAQAQRQRGN